MAKGDSETPKRRKPLSGLDDKDVATLRGLVAGAITDGRADQNVDDEEMARLYALQGKLKNISDAREN